MKNYTTKQIKGGTAFRCSRCPHSVTTYDFIGAKGNRRTQAAAALNKHNIEVHPFRSMPPSGLLPVIR